VTLARPYPGLLGRVVRDPFALLLVAAGLVQLTEATAPDNIIRPGWVVAAEAVFAGTCVAAVVGRRRDTSPWAIAPPYLLLVVAGCWRAAEREIATGFGALILVAVLWLGFYGSLRQVWLALGGLVVVMTVPPVLVGDGLQGDDLRRLGLTLGLALFVGPGLNAVVERASAATLLASALEPAGYRLDAVLRAATGSMIVTTDLDGTIVAFNAGAERILGYAADEVIGRVSLLHFHDPDSGELAARAAALGADPGFGVYVAAARRDEVDIEDWTYRTKDGHRIVVSLAVSGVRNAAGELIGYVAIGSDVTEERAALQNLAAQREIYRLLVDHLPMTTVALFDAELRCLRIGGHWLTKIGSDGLEYIGRPVEEFFREPDRARARAAYEQATTRPLTVEMDLADGHSYEFGMVPLTGPLGQPLVLSVARDVTDRRQAERERQQMLAALAMSESSFREAFEGAPIGIALTTVEDAQRERFLRVNPAFAEILGRQPEDLAGVAVADVTHPEDVVLQPDLFAEGPRPKLRKRFIRPSGRPVWVEVSYTVVRDHNGVPSHVIKQIQDIQTIKESERALLDALEQQRAATASLRELDRIRTELVGTISHELRTPLTSIHGYLELLDDEPLSATQRAMLDVAMRNVERLGSLVDNLLVLVRLDSDEQASAAVTETDVPVAAAVAAALDTVRPAIAEREQELTVELPPREPVVRGDAEQLDRVLVNLLSNASKYTPPGGRIDLAMSTDERQVCIAITDTGIGIPVEEQEHLFNRFFRASTARKNAISGTGLGLAIVKSIVERHGGTVAVESDPGRGSRFTVILPLVAQAAPVTG
jgi:PAS domain S-box-containing protein